MGFGFFFFAGVLEGDPVKLARLIFAISTLCGCFFLMEVFSPIVHAGEVREETKSNEHRELSECLMHIISLQKCLAAFVSLLVS